MKAFRYIVPALVAIGLLVLLVNGLILEHDDGCVYRDDPGTCIERESDLAP